MTIYLGDFAAGSVIYVPFNTFNAAGGSVTITGLAVTDIEIYKNGSTTQRASDAGYTLLDTDGIDFDGLTGIHGFSVNTGDNTDSGFYSSGADYWIVVSAITVDSQTVSFVAATFSIENRCALRPTTAGRTLDVASTGEAGLDFGNVALPSSGPIAALGILESGTAQSVSSTTLVGRSAATDDIVKLGHTLWAYGSTQGYWQSVMIVSVSGDTFTISGWPQATPSGTITYLVFGTPTVPNSLPFAADVRQIGGSSQSATDLKDFADTGYDPSTHKVQGVVLTDTCTTLTGHTAQTGDSYARIGATGSGLTSLASQASVDTIDNFLDTEVAAILALLDDPRGEPGQGAPPVNPDLATKIDYLYKAWRNRSTQTATTYSLYADNGTTVDQKATVSDNGTVYDRGEVATGP